MIRLLRRLKLVGESKRVTLNIKKLRQRQAQQLTLLQPLQKQVDKTLLDKKISQLIQKPRQENFNTFVTRCLKPEIKNLNGLADIFVERVFEKAAHKKVPFTVKDHLKVEGMIQTCGFSDNLIPSKISSDVVQLLENEGCIAFAHTNVPQGLLGVQSSNSVFGTTLNPHNPKFISGGSSGGQATMVASKATSFGVGSDSGGSSRIPASFCGIYGYKPTGSKRLSIKGRVGPSGFQGFKIGDVDPSFGFLTRHFQDLAWLCSKTLGKSLSKDHYPMYGGEFDESRYEAYKRKKLRVGYIYENPQMKVAPGIINTIDQTLSLLKKNKHTVVQFKFPKMTKFRDFFFEFIHQTGFLNAVFKRMQGHEVSAQMQQFYDCKLLGNFWTKYIRSRFNDPKMNELLNLMVKNNTTQQFLRMHKEIDDLKKQFMQEWNKLDIDVLISPVMPCTAMLPDATDILVYQLTFCCFQNVMELPAGVIPTRLVKQQETNYEPTTVFEKAVAESIRKSQGLPLSIQVSGRHMMDEQCLGAMWQIKRLNGNYLDPKLNNQ